MPLHVKKLPYLLLHHMLLTQQLHASYFEEIRKTWSMEGIKCLVQMIITKQLQSHDKVLCQKYKCYKHAMYVNLDNSEQEIQ